MPINFKKLDQVLNKLIHLTKLERVNLLSSLKCHKDLFDGNLGEWNGPPVEISFKDAAKPCHALSFPIMFIHLEYFKEDLYRLVATQRGLVVRAKYFGISHARGHRFRTVVSKA